MPTKRKIFPNQKKGALCLSVTLSIFIVALFCLLIHSIYSFSTDAYTYDDLQKKTYTFVKIEEIRTYKYIANVGRRVSYTYEIYVEEEEKPLFYPSVYNITEPVLVELQPYEAGTLLTCHIVQRSSTEKYQYDIITLSTPDKSIRTLEQYNADIQLEFFFVIIICIPCIVVCIFCFIKCIKEYKEYKKLTEKPEYYYHYRKRYKITINFPWRKKN